MSHVFKYIATLGGYGAALILCALFLLGLAEIICRAVFGFSLSFSVEMAGYLAGLSLLWGAGWTLLEGGHIRMTLVLDQLPERWVLAFERIGLWVGMWLSLAMTIALAQWTWGSYVRGDLSFYTSATPLWIPQALLSMGPAFLWSAFLSRLTAKTGADT